MSPRGGGTPLGDGSRSDISLASLDGFECPTVENEATGQGVHFWYVLATETLLGGLKFVKM